MPKMTLLELTQDILSDMESDEVNSIDDTVESLEVAQIIKSTYYSIIDGRDWPHLNQFFQLTASGDAALPIYMTLPERVSEVKWIKYDCKEFGETREQFKEVKHKSPEDFMLLLDARNSDDSTITQILEPSNSIPLNIINNTGPKWYTSFDNEHLIFDSFDSGIDTTLQTAKTQCYGKIDPTWTMEDSFVPNLPANAFSYLLNESKSTCFLRVKQMADNKAEQHSITQKRRMSQRAWRVAGGIKFPNYGRKK